MDRRPTNPPSDDADGDPLIGEVLGERYKVVSRVGEGGMGTVYLGKHVTLGKAVALKVLKPEFADDQALAERFLREAQVASRIGHENIVDIIDFGQTIDGAAYFVMEHLDGRELDDLLAREGRLPWPRARGILVQIARALGAAHRAGVIHRDLKPGNILLISREHNPDYVKLLDFGIAKLEGEAGLTHAGMVFGTVGYMSPEQAKGESVDARTDIYALGCVAFEMLTGQLPFDDRNPQRVLDMHIEVPAPSLRSLVPHARIPAAVEATLLQALAKDPDARFADMAAFERALSAVAPELEVSSSAEEAVGPTTIVATRRPAARQGARRTPVGKRVTTSPKPVRGMAVPLPAELPLLATLYLGLAYGADGELSSSENELLIDRIHEWTLEVPRREVGRLLRYTLADLRGLDVEARNAQIHGCARELSELLPRTQLAAVLADLYELAGADDRVLDPELRYIVNVTSALGLTPDPRLLATAYLFLTLGHADGHLDGDEQRVLGEQLQAWSPDSSEAEVRTVLRWAAAEFERRPSYAEQLACAREAADQLRLSADPDALRRILADLWRIAGADGHIAVEEQRFIMDMVERFGTAG